MVKMESTYWVKQKKDSPLFDDLLWSRPENRATAGKLLIIGGNGHEFADISLSYQMSQSAGAGTIRLLLPKSLQSKIANFLPEADFLPATKGGNFSAQSLDGLLEHAKWADCVLLPGELGHNSETAVLIEKLLTKTKLPVCATKDASGVIINLVEQLKNRGKITLTISIAELKTLVGKLGLNHVVTFSIDTLRLTELLHKITEEYPVNIVVKHSGNIFVACAGRVSTTPSDKTEDDKWRVEIAARSAVWLMQNINNSFEALTTSVLDLE